MVEVVLKKEKKINVKYGDLVTWNDGGDYAGAPLMVVYGAGLVFLENPQITWDLLARLNEEGEFDEEFFFNRLKELMDRGEIIYLGRPKKIVFELEG